MTEDRPGGRSGVAVSTPFYITGALLLMCAAAGITLMLTALFHGGGPGEAAFLVASAALAGLSIFLLTWPANSRSNSAIQHEIPGMLQDISSRVGCLDGLQRSQEDARQALQALDITVQEQHRPIEKMCQTIIQGLLEREKLDEALILQRQEVARLQGQVKNWRGSAQDFLELCQRALSQDGLDPKYRAAMNKSVKDFSRLVSPLGLDVIRPAPGDLFDDRVHEAGGEQEDSQIEPGHIAVCERWGFRSGAEMLQKARVILARAPVHALEEPPHVDPCPESSGQYASLIEVAGESSLTSEAIMMNGTAGRGSDEVTLEQPGEADANGAEAGPHDGSPGHSGWKSLVEKLGRQLHELLGPAPRGEVMSAGPEDSPRRRVDE